MEMSRFLYEVGFFGVTLPWCPDVNANHPIERNYGNSVRFLAKIPNGTAAESPCYSVFWNAIDFCRLYTSKKISMWALPTVPLFDGKSRFFTRKVPLKTFSRLAGLSPTSSFLDPVHSHCRNEEISLFKQVLQHPSYKTNPLSTITEHLKNKLKQEESMDS